jgi:hypothetical protein
VSRHCIQKKRCFAAEVWDAKGLAIPTLGYDFALPRGARKNGGTVVSTVKDTGAAT